MAFEQDYIEQLITQKLTGNITVDEDAVLKALIQDDAAVQALWKETAAAYHMYSAGVFASRLNEGAAWQKVQEALVAEEGPVVYLRPGRRRMARWITAAACILLLAGAGLVAWWGLSHRGDTITARANPPIVLKLANGKTIELASAQQHMRVQNGATASLRLQDGSILADAANDKIGDSELNALTIPEGKDYYLQLADGTEVWLNAASELQFPLSFGKQRLVKLKGEAYFKVAKDAARPFLVNTGAMDVKVLGTEFNLKYYPEEAPTTSLVTGEVAVSTASGEQVKLLPGQAARAGENNHLQVNEFDETITLAWMKGLYLFNDESLQSIRYTIERWYGVQVELDQTIGLKRFTGAMEKDKTLEVFLKNIAVTSNVKYRTQNNTVHFY
jgi:ferric-dicitrate binding protein FerR (iron transport regulator)